ncbi:MAG: sodium/proton-translocating pyrophosphatase [Victivallales bacterium]|nr:sodium/proton-translocating pyrophosphatase [Victivallales bacterium]
MKKSLILSGIAMLTGAFSATAQVPEAVGKCVKAAPAALNTIPVEWYSAPLGAILALLIAVLFYKKLMKASEGNDTMKEIAQHVREGAMAYLFRQYKVVTAVFAILFVIFAALAFAGLQNAFVPVAFLTGGFFSGLCGYIGMKTATNASARTAQAASEGLNRGLRVAFTSGAVMGLVVVGLGLLDICIWYYALDQWFFTPENMKTGWTIWGLELVPANCSIPEKYVYITTTMITFGMGASTQALFARVGGGIFTKAADVGADLVGKVEAGIPEDDPRNPATIADNVGDNVGDVAGMGADLYESYCGSILATAALGAAVGVQQYTTVGGADKIIKLITAPMIVAGIGIVLSIIGMYLVKTKEGASQKDLLKSLLVGTLGSSIMILLALVYLQHLGFITWGIFGSVVAGLAAGVIIGQATEYYTSAEFKPTKGIA